MNRLSVEKRAMIIRCLTEGNSVRATCRLSGAAKGTVLKLIPEFGEFASWYQDKTLVGLPCQKIQMDEIWSFCGAKEKNKSTSKNPQAGDVWTWTSLCSDTKLAPSWYVSDRSLSAASTFCNDLASRLANRPQICTDGFRAYMTAVRGAFNGEVDHGRLVKIYGTDIKGNEIVVGAKKEVVTGFMDKEEINTSYVERQNLTMRMNMRRFTRLTNGFSKKLENHAAMTSIHFLNYNFMRKHQTIKTAPAVAAGVVDNPIQLEEFLEEFDRYLTTNYPPNRPKHYKKKRDTPKTWEPRKPKLPWYLDPNGEEPS